MIYDIQCQKYFGFFLPVRHQRTDIRTARSLDQFVQCLLRSSTKTREWTFS